MIARAAFLATLLCSGLAAADAVNGKEMFRSCQGCHNTATDERKTGPSLRSLFGKVTLRSGKHADDENVREIVLDGFNGMPSFRYSFRATEIDDLMAYLHTLTGRPAVPEMSPGAAYFKAYCARCHSGTDLRGKFRPESVPLLEDGHAGAAPLKEWLGEKERQLLFEYLRKW